MQMKKINILLILSILSIVAKSQIIELKRYLIPSPKEITIKNENSEIIVNKFNSFFKKIKQTNFIGKIPTIRFLYSISEFETRVDSSLTRNDEYILEITNRKISITGKTAAAVFYGKQTLLQIIEYSANSDLLLPCLNIHDYADFTRRGFMLDISRDKVPKMETLFMIIDKLSSWKINEFQLYTEHTFAYKNHSIVWKEYSPMTPEEIKQLDNYCKERFIDLVPNQNSFGHMERWLEHDEYLDLAECPDYCNTVWGPMKRSSLNPVNPRSFELLQELYAELYNLIEEHKRVWVYRNRVGGLKQSASKLEEVLEYYKQ
jgi:N-acetyl-beta-hexosaminidase